MSHSNQMLEKMSYISDGGNREEIPIKSDQNRAMCENIFVIKVMNLQFVLRSDMRKFFTTSKIEL